LIAVLNIIRIGRIASPVLVVLAWSISLAALTLGQIFQGHLIPQHYYGGVSNELVSDSTIFYLEVLGLSSLAGVVIQEAQRAILSFISCYVMGSLITCLVLMLPGFVNSTAIPQLVFEMAIVDTFTALFPIPLLVGLAGTFLGLVLSDRFFR
jgi:hypothetical protein